MSRPNIILITADQLRFDYVGAYGVHDFIDTPVMDTLAHNGCLCTNAYSPNPVCIPARHNLITGLTAKHHGFDDNYFAENARSSPWYLPTFAQILSDAGYRTTAIGKMHFQPSRRSTGFDSFINADEVVADVQDDEYALDLIKKGYGDIGSYHGVRNILYMQPQQSFMPEELHNSYWITDKAIDYIDKISDKETPFLMWLGFKHPHPPFDVPSAWADKYNGKIPKHTSSKTPLSLLAEENKCIADLPDEENINRMRELYASAVSYVDYNIGRLVEKLKTENLLDNTMIIVTSDHGEMLGDLDTYQKSLPYDSSCKIPFILHCPNKIKSNTVVNDFVDLNDILPTMLDLAGTTYPANFELPGESLFAENKIKDRNVQYVEHQRESKRWCSLRNHKYKYVYHYGDSEQLFDMVNDKNEQVNLLYNCADKDIFKIKNNLKAQLIKYEEKYGLDGYISDDKFKEFPPYKINNYLETIYPHMTKRKNTIRPLEIDILEAIKNEPTVKLEKLNIRKSLMNIGGFTEEQVDDLLNQAKKQGN